jgi:hypothetical protein
MTTKTIEYGAAESNLPSIDDDARCRGHRRANLRAAVDRPERFSSSKAIGPCIGPLDVINRARPIEPAQSAAPATPR